MPLGQQALHGTALWCWTASSEPRSGEDKCSAILSAASLVLARSEPRSGEDKCTGTRQWLTVPLASGEPRSGEDIVAPRCTEASQPSMKIVVCRGGRGGRWLKSRTISLASAFIFHRWPNPSNRLIVL